MHDFTHKLALGTVQFGLPYGISNTQGQTPFEEVQNILNFAHQMGILTLDTAYAYGDAEEILGKLNRNRFDIITKFLPEKDEETIQFQFQASLTKLKTSQVYGYLAHRPLDLVNNPHVWEYLNDLKYKHKVKKIGFSLNEPLEFYKLLEKGFIPDLVQIPFNYFDHRFIEIAKELKNANCEIHTRSTFLQGLFFMDTTQLSSHFDPVKPWIADLQRTYPTNLADALLRYVLSFHWIDKVVLGVQNLAQLRNNISLKNNSSKLALFTEKIDDLILQPSKWV